ncbi:RNA polymerase sigma factor [Algoriphagus namhaensis]
MKNEKERLFEEIYHSQKDKIYRLCLGFAKEEDQAKDLFQEILIKVWRYLGDFRKESSLSTWVYRIASNTAITFVSKAQKMKAKSAELPQDLILESPDPIQSESEYRLSLLYRAINELSEQDRIIASLLLEGTAYREIAEITGITENYVAVKVSRIKTSLSKKLNPQPYGN